MRLVSTGRKRNSSFETAPIFIKTYLLDKCKTGTLFKAFIDISLETQLPHYVLLPTVHEFPSLVLSIRWTDFAYSHARYKTSK
jgi:hypothetical protein